MTPAGIEPATFRLVAEHLNHCATAVPHIYIFFSWYACYMPRLSYRSCFGPLYITQYSVENLFVSRRMVDWRTCSTNSVANSLVFFCSYKLHYVVGVCFYVLLSFCSKRLTTNPQQNIYNSITSNGVQSNTTSLTNIFIDRGLHVSIH